MAYFEVEIRHTEKTFEALAHMQYDLFCGGNRAARTVISFALVLAGVLNFSKWWGVLIVAYGCYLTTSTYSSANHTAHKLAAQIQESGMPFPASRYRFLGSGLEISSLSEKKEITRLSYSQVYRLGEDFSYFYLFRDRYGGYMVPKEALGEKAGAFRDFLEKQTGQTFRMRGAPILRVARWLRARENRPERLK